MTNLNIMKEIVIDGETVTVIIEKRRIKDHKFKAELQELWNTLNEVVKIDKGQKSNHNDVS